MKERYKNSGERLVPCTLKVSRATQVAVATKKKTQDFSLKRYTGLLQATQPRVFVKQLNIKRCQLVIIQKPGENEKQFVAEASQQP